MVILRQFFIPRPIDTAEISIHAIGIQEPMRPCIVDRPGGTQDYLFMFFYDDVLIGMEGTPRSFPQNSLVIWDPEHGHYYGNPAQPWQHSWIHCDGAFIQSILAAHPLPRNTPLRLPDPVLVEKYLHDLYREVTEFAQPDAHIVCNIMENWVREIQRAVEDTRGPCCIPPHFLALKHFLGTHFHERLTLPDLAAQVNLSVPHFCSEFKRYFGMPAIGYLIHLRLQQAAYLLRDQQLNISEIARQVGYHDLYQFSKQFKRHYHLSPSAFRRGLLAV
jgi:AraC family transcriptional regulator of arabinose operon